MDILSIIKSKNPEDISQKELDEFRLMIEAAEQSLNKLQRIHKELTGREYVTPARLRETMAHPMNDLINRIEGTEALPCDKSCKYFKFPYLERACVLSAVFSVLQGEPCFEYEKQS